MHNRALDNLLSLVCAAGSYDILPGFLKSISIDSIIERFIINFSRHYSLLYNGPCYLNENLQYKEGNQFLG